ncbi:hypothetical protein TcWFU_008271 [Taenia crassiceps]|uniref:Uncharacterized protein n=1 Tax=Taenia crassiceps TaxID=6207 RepID=A0ABR4Q426_9CEST
MHVHQGTRFTALQRAPFVSSLCEGLPSSSYKAGDCSVVFVDRVQMLVLQSRPALLFCDISPPLLERMCVALKVCRMMGDPLKVDQSIALSICLILRNSWQWSGLHTPSPSTSSVWESVQLVQVTSI